MLTVLFFTLATLGGAAIGALGSRRYWTHRAEQAQLNRLADRFLAKHEV